MFKRLSNLYNDLKKYDFFSRHHISSWLYLFALISICCLRFFLVGYIDAGFETFFQIFNGTPLGLSGFISHNRHYLQWITLDICLSVSQSFLSLRMMDSISLKLKEKMLSIYFKKSTLYGDKLLKNNKVTFSQVIENDIDALVFVMVRRISTILEQSMLGIAALHCLWTYSGYITILGVPVAYLPLAACLFASVFWFGSHYFSTNLNQRMMEEKSYDQEVLDTLSHVNEHAHSIALSQGGKYEHNNIIHFLKQKYWNRKIQHITKGAIGLLALCHEKTVFLMSVIVCLPSILEGMITSSRLLNIAQHFVSIFKLGSIYNASIDQTVIDVAKQRIDSLLDSYNDWHKLYDKQFEKIKNGVPIEITGPITVPGKQILSAQKSLIFSKRYNQLQAPSGGGKTTVFNTLAGLNPNYLGMLQQPKEMIFIPQSPYILPGRASLLDNCCYPELLLDKDTHIQKVINLMKTLHFSDYIIDKLNKTTWKDNTGSLVKADWSQTLSVGERQCISLIRAILHNPAVLVIDEGTSALDSSLKNTYFKIIDQYLPKTTIIYSDHHDKHVNNTKHLKL